MNDDRNAIEQQPPLSTQLATYWTVMSKTDRNTLYLLYGGEETATLTDEELEEMEGCGV